MFIQTIRQFFPNSIIQDAALKYPITPAGWNIDMPGKDECRFEQKDFWLILNLQDMLTGGWGQMPYELKVIHDFYKGWAPLDRIIVVTWPIGLAETWLDSFHVVEFSTHQYETWQSYSHKEDYIRAAFADDNKRFENNFVCMNRIAKPHRKITHGRLNSFNTGNCSLQAAGIELKYPGLSFNDYDEQYNNLNNLLSLSENYNTSLFSVVTESQYAEEFGIITEKSFNAIVAGHLLMIVGHRHALDNLSSYGFQTYNKIFGEEYQHSSNQDRIDDMIFENLDWFERKMSASEMRDVYLDCADIVDYNRNWFFDEFGPTQLDWFRTQLLNIWN